MIFADVLGMSSSDFKDVAIAVVGFLVLYLQYRNNQKTDAAKTEAENAKGEAQSTRAESATARIEFDKKLETVASNVNGKMSQLLVEHGILKKLEGKEEGKAQAQAEAGAIHAAVLAAAPAIAAAVVAQPAPPPAAPPGVPKSPQPQDGVS